MKYLLQAIDARRECVRLSDHELRDLLIEVRSGKDDRIEFTESMVRLLDELKSSEHATAFLTKVAKRDAPDYYDVIKNPMDLGTMMRNVRQARYKSKSQFVRDLDLIWDNCLTYNSEPTHPLRRSVQMLRAKANHLLTYVNDTNDVKEALNQWQASIGLQRRRSESLDGSRKDGAGVASEQVAGNAAGRDRLGSGAFGMSRIGGGVTSGAAADMVDTPFEQRPALLRNADGMSTFQRLDASLTALDEEFMRRYMGTEAGPSSRPFDSSAEQGLSAAASLDMLKTLEGPQGGMLRRALTTPSQLSTNGVTANGSAPHDGDGSPSLDSAAAAAADADEETRMPYDAGAAWWNGMVHPSLLAAGVMPLAPSEATANKRIRTIHGRPGKRRRKQVHALGGKMEGQDGKAQQQPFGGVDALERNVRTIVRLRRTHAKFGRLSSHIESGEPIPADLGVVSSDDESGNESADEAATTQTHILPKVRRKAPDALALPFHDLAGNPFAKLGGERASDMLQSNTNVLLAHAGFDGSQKAAADVLADVAGEFLMNVGRTLRNYTDRFAHEMSVEDLVLHTLYENGGLDVRRLESYVADDVLRYGNKMSDLLRKLRASYRDTLASADLPMADEAAYFGAEAHAERTASQGGVQAGGTDGDGGDEHILRGGYARELADEDFFGFKDMGLDAELGIDVGRQLASMPSRMFSRKDGAAGPGGAANGVGAKARLGGGSAESGRSMLEFEPPPPFVPMSEAAIAAQIAVLRPFYRELMRTRGQWQRIGGDDGDGSAAAVQTNSFGADGDADRTDADDPKNAFVILPDEEQERQRYKVPPTGKMPRRAMKQRQAPQQASGAAGGGAASSNGKSSNAQAAARKLTAPPSTSQAKSNGASMKSKSKSGGGGGGGGGGGSGKKKDTSTGGTKQATTNFAVTVG